MNLNELTHIHMHCPEFLRGQDDVNTEMTGELEKMDDLFRRINALERLCLWEADMTFINDVERPYSIRPPPFVIETPDTRERSFRALRGQIWLALHQSQTLFRRENADLECFFTTICSLSIPCAQNLFSFRPDLDQMHKIREHLFPCLHHQRKVRNDFATFLQSWQNVIADKLIRFTATHQTFHSNNHIKTPGE